MRLDRGHDLVALRELAPRGVVGARDHGVGVRGVGAAARLEDELIHAGEAAEDQVEAVHELEHALQRLVGLVGMQLRDLGPRDELPASRGLYFIVHVPKRLTPIIPSVSCERWR